MSFRLSLFPPQLTVTVAADAEELLSPGFQKHRSRWDE
jgi:hypothetical protein